MSVDHTIVFDQSDIFGDRQNTDYQPNDIG